MFLAEFVATNIAGLKVPGLSEVIVIFAAAL
jgi:hypothetical protein